jgi:CHAT domain-containing protein/uncharacterized protein HemY
MMPHRKKSSKLAHFCLLPFSLCLVGGAEVVQAQVRREGNAKLSQRVLDNGDIPIDISNDLNIPISPSNRDIPVRVPSLVIPNNSQIIQSRKAEADRLLKQGSERRRANDYNNAIQLDLKALAICQEIRYSECKVDAFNGLGLAYDSLRKYEKAIEYYRQSLEIARESKELKNEVVSLLKLGNAYFRLGQYKKAINFYEQSLAINKQIGDLKGESNSLIGLGNVYNSLAQYQRAIDFYQQSLKASKQIGDNNAESTLLNNLGTIYDSLGQYQRAIDFFQLSLEIKKQIGDRNGESNSLSNLGNTYNSLGQYQKAIDFFQQSLAIDKQIGDLNGESYSLNNIGNSYNSLGQYQRAIDFYQQSLEISKQIGDRKGEGSLLNNLGFVYNSLRQYQRAIDSFQQSLVIKRQIGDLNGEAGSLNNLGIAYNYLGQYQQAIDFYQQSSTISREIGDRRVKGSALANLGEIFSKVKHLELAILFYKQSINVRESIRKDIKKLDKDLQQSYLATVENTYRDLADTLLQQNRIMEALQVLDLLKVQELEDYLKNIKGSDRSAQGVRLLAPEQAFSDKLLAVSFENSKDINNQLANQIQQLPKTEINKVPDYLNQIPQGTVLLYPFILGDRLEIILFAPNNPPIRRTVKIAGAELKELTDDFRNDLLDSYFFDVKSSAAKLYDILIKPIEADLVQFNTKTILYAPDGQLRYVPLAALYDGKQWLAEKYQISNLIAYTLTDLRHSSRNLQPNILAGAFGGKAGEKKFGEDGLPATIIEVDKITDYFQDRAIALKENQFSRQAVESKFKNHNVLHFATHAALNSGNPDQSYIIFGNGDRIHLNEIDDWQIPNMELMVLSACQTGFSEIANGIEILGFGYQLQKAGVKNSIASLWKVKDEGTQVLMDNFYSSLQKGNVTVSEALQQAQLSLIKSKDYNHPYYWSAFFAIGNGL